MTTKLLFVCTGNHCRSPIAHYLAIDLADAWKVEVEVRSAGTHPLVGVPPPEEGLAAMEQWGLDMSGHRGEPITPELLDWADAVFALDRGHRSILRAQRKGQAPPILLLQEHADLPDPLGGDTEAFCRCRDRIAEHLPHAFQRVGLKRPLWHKLGWRKAPQQESQA